MAELAFCDTETLGLDPVLHDVWEVAVILATSTDSQVQVERQTRWFVELPEDALRLADPTALRLTRFWQRTEDAAWMSRYAFAREFARATAGRDLVGAVPSFDSERLQRLLTDENACGAWHYHLVDVENLIAGKLGIQPPWDSKVLYEKAGVALLDDDEAHTAAGDARQVLHAYASVYDLTVVGFVRP
jgi:hypothetical protein